VALETASFVANLVATNPDGGDARSTADDHLRLIKASLVRTFPKVDGAVSLSAVQYMFLNDVSASVQLQLNQLRDGSATANNAINARYANSASVAILALTANSASYAALAGTAAIATTAVYAEEASLAGVAALANFATNAGNANTATTATNATNATNATYALTATSASSAALLSGLAASEDAGASTIVARTAAGYIFAVYLNQSTALEVPAIGSVFVQNTNADGYLRKASLATLGSQMDARNISTKTGITKTLASGSGPPSLTGSTNGDIWFFY
jgi:hypothetical protein